MPELARVSDALLDSIIGDITADRATPPVALRRLRERAALSTAFDIDQLGQHLPEADLLLTAKTTSTRWRPTLICA